MACETAERALARVGLRIEPDLESTVKYHMLWIRTVSEQFCQTYFSHHFLGAENSKWHSGMLDGLFPEAQVSGLRLRSALKSAQESPSLSSESRSKPNK